MIFKNTSEHNVLRLKLRPVSMWLAMLAPSAMALFFLVAIFQVDLTVWADKLGAPMWFAHNRWALVLICIYLGLGGHVFIHLFIGTITIELNKNKRKVYVIKSAKRLKSFDLNMADIKEAKYTSESCRQGRVYNDVFVLDSGEIQEICAGRGRAEAVKVCRLINAYLGLHKAASLQADL